MILKESKYNLKVEREEGNVLFANTLTGAVIMLSEKQIEEYNNIIGKDIDTGDNNEFIDDLVKGKFLINETFNELSFLKTRFLMNKFSDNTLNLTIVPTLKCNFSCDYCFVEKNEEHMTQKVQDDIIKYIESRAKGIEKLNITFFGGEPLIAIDIIENLSKRMITICEKNNTEYEAGIITNGYLLTQEVAEKLKNLRINSLQITLDGNQETHDERRNLANGKGTYTTILQNIKSLPNHFNISLRINIDKENAKSLDDLLEDLESYNIKDKVVLNLGKIDDIGTYGSKVMENSKGLSCEAFSEIELEFCKKATARRWKAPLIFSPISLYCGATTLDSFEILPDGSLQKCFSNMGRKTDNFSNISDPEIFHEKNLEWMENDPFTHEECSECKILPMCMGGCVIESKLNDNKPQCINWKYQVDSFFKNLEINNLPEDRNKILWIFEPQANKRGCVLARCNCFTTPCSSFKFPCQVNF